MISRTWLLDRSATGTGRAWTLRLHVRAALADSRWTAAALGSIGATLVIIEGLAALLRGGPGTYLEFSLATAATAVGVLGSFLVRGHRLDPAAVIATAASVALLTLYSAVVFSAAPTVVWLYAFVIPGVGLVRGPSQGALAGFLSAPAIAWIETGVAVDLLDPQVPFAFLILILLGAVPGVLLEVARTRQVALDGKIQETGRLLVEAQAAREAERDAHRLAVFMLAEAAEARDGTTGVHIRRVEDLAREMATACGLEPGAVDDLAWSAMLHDVGKIRVPDRVLLKPGSLDDEEWALIRRHPIWGEELLRGHAAFALARTIARHHHENWDGSGYPDGLIGAAIPFAARIVHLVDVYDALRSDRPYKPAWPEDRAMEEIRAMRGRSFDPDLADLFLSLRQSRDQPARITQR